MSISCFGVCLGWVLSAEPQSLSLCTPSSAAVLGEAAVQMERNWSKDAAFRSIGVIYVIVKGWGGGGEEEKKREKMKIKRKSFSISQLHKAAFALTEPLPCPHVLRQGTVLWECVCVYIWIWAGVEDGEGVSHFPGG